MSAKKQFLLRLVLVAGIVGWLALNAVLPVQASGHFSSGASRIVTSNFQQEDPPPGDDGGLIDGVVDGICEVIGGVCNIVEEIKSFVEHKILFPFQSLADAVTTALTMMNKSAVEQLSETLTNAVSGAMSWMYSGHDMRLVFKPPSSEGTPPELDPVGDVTYVGWKIMMAVSGILLPLSLIMTVGAAMKDGVSSVTGYASAREALTEWVISVGLAGSSYFLINKLFITLSSAASWEIVRQLTALDVDIPKFVVGTFVTFLAASVGLGVFAQLFIALFCIFFVVALVTSLLLALFAREVILMLLTVIAPVVLVIGCIREARWLVSLWIKALVMALLIGPVNTILLGIGALLVRSSATTVGAAVMAPGLDGAVVGAVNAFVGVLVAIGVISILIAINMMIGQTVYGAAIEVGEKAWDTTMGIAKTAVSLVAAGAGLAAAPAIGGALAGTGGAAAGGAAATGAEAGAGALGAGGAGGGAGDAAALPGGGTPVLPTGGAGGAGSGGGSGGPRPMADIKSDQARAAQEFGRSRQAAMLTQKLGGVLGRTGNPMLSGFGWGLQARGVFDDSQAFGQFSGKMDGLGKEEQAHLQVDADAAKQEADAQAAQQTMIKERMGPRADAELSAGESSAVQEVQGVLAAQGIPVDLGTLSGATAYSNAIMNACAQNNLGHGQVIAATTPYNPGAEVDRFSHYHAAFTRSNMSTYIDKDGLSFEAGRPHLSWDRSSPNPTVSDHVFFAEQALTNNARNQALDPDYIAAGAIGVAYMRHYGGVHYETMAQQIKQACEKDTTGMGVYNWAYERAREFPGDLDRSAFPATAPAPRDFLGLVNQSRNAGS